MLVLHLNPILKAIMVFSLYLQGHAFHLADKAVGRVGSSQVIFHKIGQDNNYCFSIQHIDGKAQFSTFSGKMLEELPLFSVTHKFTYIAGYLLSMHNEY